MEERGMNKRSLVFRLIVVATLLATIAWLAFHRSFLEPSVLERELQRFGRLAPIFFVLLYAVATVLFAPGSIVTIAGGALSARYVEPCGTSPAPPWGPHSPL
jgi:uncharacterized membrane protein YdjX (TVP38/TMEM64 family)